SLLSFYVQAEDGIRDRNVTGVQTCALPISARRLRRRAGPGAAGAGPTGRVRRQRRPHQIRLRQPVADHRRFRSRQPQGPELAPEDRKSTRLNSSHVSISYAVFCLKKKKRKRAITQT